jgi:hypothetical protein
MSPRELPDRPDLDQLKKQAKALLRAATAREPDALARLAVLPGFTGEAALHDAQSALAREYGFASWHRLRDEVDARTVTFEAAVEAFLRAATGGAAGRARRLLDLHPRIATATLHTELVLGDAAAVGARLRAQPELAVQPGGPLQWEPLLYVCHTCAHRDDPGRADGLVAIARQLCGRGANANAEYHWNWHPELPRTALWGALCAVGHRPLAEVLLEAGARPTDGVSSQIAAGLGNLDALELLHRFGLDPDGLPGGVPPLVYCMTFATDPAGPRWLLEHGADANLAWGPDGEAPLHVAARRWDVAMVDLLVRHGADLARRRADGRTPHTLAELHGHRDVAAWLRRQGAADDLSPLDRFAAACARGDDGDADAMLRAHPGLAAGLRNEHHLMLHGPAESGRAEALTAMVTRGFDPAAADKDAVTPLHRAAMAGHPDAVRVLLEGGAPVNALDGMFSATPLVWAVEGRGHASPGADHVAVARLLIAAGSSVEWTPPPGAPNQEQTLEGLSAIRRDAARRP